MRDVDNVSIRTYPDKENRVWGSSITHLEKVDPLSSDNLKRTKGALDKLPDELLIQSAAYATAQSDSLLVAMNTENWY